MSKKITCFDPNPTFTDHIDLVNDNDQFITDGKPVESNLAHFTNEAGNFIAGTWECTAGVLKLSDYSMDEYCYMKEGELVITDEEGNETVHKAGDSFTIPKGFNGIWDMKTTIVKDYVVLI